MKNTLKSTTFSYKELTFEIHPEVYDPAEDSFQLLEAIQVKKGDTVLEIGTGCGVVALACAQIGANIVCSDINPYAVELTKRNYELNKSHIKGNVDIREGDLFSVLEPEEQFDCIVFNPPYLPTKAEDRIGGTDWFDVATDGGTSGLKITKRFIEEARKYLHKNGHIYLVFSSLSDRNAFNNIISKAGFQAEIVLSRRFNDEQIDVYCLHY